MINRPADAGDRRTQRAGPCPPYAPRSYPGWFAAWVAGIHPPGPRAAELAAAATLGRLRGGALAIEVALTRFGAVAQQAGAAMTALAEAARCPGCHALPEQDCGCDVAP